MKKLALVLLGAVMIFALCACGSTAENPATTPETGTDTSAVNTERTAADDLTYVQDNGKMVIGITDYQPMNYYDTDGTLIGFDTDLTKAVCEKLGVEAEFIEITWDSKETELNSFNIDCLWNGLTYTAERAENMSFANNYLYNNIVVVVRADDADKYKTLEDLAGANVVSEAGSSGEKCVLADEGLSTNYIGVASLVNALMEVAAGTADAAVVDSIMAYDLVGSGSYENLAIVDGVILSQEELGIGFRKDSSLVPEVNKALNELWADGTINTIAEKYNLQEVLIDFSKYE